MRAGGQKQGGAGATVGYEAELWRMADALRGSIDCPAYQHVQFTVVHGRKRSGIYSHGSNNIGSCLARMNVTIRGIAE